MRAKAFESLPVSEAYKGYFFLQEHLNKLQSSTVTSLMAKAESLQAQRPKPLLKILTGLVKPINWLKKVFSISKG